MSVVRTHGDLMVEPSRTPSPRLFLHHSADHAHHIRTASEVFCFVKRSVRLSCHLTQMHEVNASAELASHGQQVVVGSGSERPNTKRKPVGERFASRENGPHILGGRNDSRKTEQRPRRVVRV